VCVRVCVRVTYQHRYEEVMKWNANNGRGHIEEEVRSERYDT